MAFQINGGLGVTDEMLLTSNRLFFDSGTTDLNINFEDDGVFKFEANSHFFNNDLNVGEKTQIRLDGNITMTSPNGTKFNCGVTDAGSFECN